eukprot:2636805-Alexandrium_andersonii.AAC.1
MAREPWWEYWPMRPLCLTLPLQDGFGMVNPNTEDPPEDPREYVAPRTTRPAPGPPEAERVGTTPTSSRSVRRRTS